MRRAVPLATLAVMTAAACGADADETTTAAVAQADASAIQVEIASYDLSVGGSDRFLAGLLTDTNAMVSGGAATLSFTGPDGETGAPVSAPFEPIAADEHEGGHGGEAAVTGVYIARGVQFDEAGTWRVTADVAGPTATLQGSAEFEVGAEPAVPAPGDGAPPSDSLTVDSDAALSAIDSRAELEGEVPDPALHETSIADALAASRPLVVVFATPVYCASRFCGPVTDLVENLAGEFRSRAAFVHIEIWNDFEGQALNGSAAEWLLRDDTVQEPWVFLVGADGVIDVRLDNVTSRAEVVSWLESLPEGGADG